MILAAVLVLLAFSGNVGGILLSVDGHSRECSARESL